MHWLDETLDWDSYVELSRLISSIEPSGGILTNKFKSSFLEYYREEINYELRQENALSDLYDISDYISSQLDAFISEMLSFLHIPFDADDRDYIGDNFDVSSHIDYNFNQQDDGTNESIFDPSPSRFPVQEIDDLFDRS